MDDGSLHFGLKLTPVLTVTSYFAMTTQEFTADNVRRNLTTCGQDSAEWSGATGAADTVGGLPVVPRLATNLLARSGPERRNQQLLHHGSPTCHRPRSGTSS
jgi:hypothetical protein